MRAVIQRVTHASVHISGATHAQIGKGFLVLLGIEEADTIEDIIWLSNKIVGLRVFNDADEKMNL
jgi:D-tyrosyl-tRNA(Tyr) deacylase